MSPLTVLGEHYLIECQINHALDLIHALGLRPAVELSDQQIASALVHLEHLTKNLEGALEGRRE